MISTDSPTPALPFSQDVQDLLQLYGISNSYINYAGENQEIPYSNRLKILGLMSKNLTSPDDVSEILKLAHQELIEHWLPAASVIECDQKVNLSLRVSPAELEDKLNWLVTTESNELLSGYARFAELTDLGRSDEGQQSWCNQQLSLPPLPEGYHQLNLSTSSQERDFLLIAAPRKCYSPSRIDGAQKLAGISLHLYSLRSERNWGIGDFADLTEFSTCAAEAGLDFIVLNPLHILDSVDPQRCSPYSPLDRRYLNPLYIDIEQEPDFHESETIGNYVAKPAFQARLAELREAELVDYHTVNHLKLAVLSKMFRHFRRRHLQNQTERGVAFREWLAAQDDELKQFGKFQANRFRLSLSMARYAEFHYYLQWMAEKQLFTCQALARSNGMKIGLIRDLAVGSDRNSAEVHLNPGLYNVDASIGAPPDPFAPQGQNWGLPPLNPLELKATGYRHFIELLKNNMANCGALRIDHIMAFMRLWWCPGTDHSGKGAYVSYPAEDLFAILRLESQRQKCIIIGEDLGVVPPEIRHLMEESGVFSNLLFYFEKYDPIHFKHPHHWNSSALAMVANHDVATLAAWWSKFDLALRDQIGLFEEAEELTSAISARESDLIQILHWLNELHLLPERWQDFNIHRTFDQDLCRAILQANGMSASRLVSLQPEDLCLMEKPTNIPGTSKQYPNWRRKLPVSVTELFADPGRKDMLEAFVSSRKSP